MLTLIAGTTNLHKLREIRDLLPVSGINLVGLSDFTSIPEVIEDRLTFEENALKKARVYHSHFKQAVFADDSGLRVPALNGEPGVRSARYAGEPPSYLNNNLLLVEKIRSLPPEKRKAHFICVICYKDRKEEKIFTGITHGVIQTEFRGENGFGYDPIFYLPELKKTFAELTTSEKNKHSHRGKALRQLAAYLQAYKSLT